MPQVKSERYYLCVSCTAGCLRREDMQEIRRPGVGVCATCSAKLSQPGTVRDYWMQSVRQGAAE